MSVFKSGAPRSRDFALCLQVAARKHQLGRFAAAAGIYRVVLQQCPDYPQVRIDLSRTLFALRQWPEAWLAFGARFEAFEGRNEPALVARAGLQSTPRMTEGSRPARVAIVGEGGLGDLILFSRFVSRLIASGIDARLIAPRRLIPLLRTMDPAPAFAGDDEPGAGAGCDAWAPLMDLPALLGVQEAELSAPQPVLRAEPERVEHWRAWLHQQRGENRGPTFAIAWRGGAENRAAGLRSAHLPDFAPIAAIPGATLVCLQKDATEDEIRDSGFAGQILRPQIPFDEDGAFLDSAALLMNVDSLVSIDTALVHLAGALSRPCELLLGQDPDWRWLDMAPGNVWHPSVRVWRCAAAETYADLVARCAQEATATAPALSPALASVA
jgi:hypothetical protein